MTLREEIAFTICDNRCDWNTHNRCTYHKDHVPCPANLAFADAILSLLSKEGKELPLVEKAIIPLRSNPTEHEKTFYAGALEQCCADQPYVTAANARAEKAEAENHKLLKINADYLGLGIDATEKIQALQAQLDKANEEVKRLVKMVNLNAGTIKNFAQHIKEQKK